MRAHDRVHDFGLCILRRGWLHAALAIVAVGLAQAIDAYDLWPRWDLWSAEVPDGTYAPSDGYLPPDQSKLIEVERLAMAFLYCWSPYRSIEGVAPIDCAILKDPARW